MKQNLALSLPDSCGVYLFKNKDDAIIYIGKAKSIKKRVSSYFQTSKTDWKVNTLIEEHDHIDYILTKTEVEALLLEAELIQKHKPKFNALLKEGNPFLYIVFIKSSDVEKIHVKKKSSKKVKPGISITRNKPAPNLLSFGPFIHRSSARSMVRFLEDTFELYRCNKTIKNGCLQYHLGRCAGTCKSNFDETDYLFRLELARDALLQNKKTFLQEIDDKIKAYSAKREYEKANKLKKYAEQIDIIFTTIQSSFSQERYLEQILFTTLQRSTTIDQTLALELQKILKTVIPIHTIDCFDISHFQGTNTVGSCIRFIDGLPDKTSFRRFKIRSLTEANDYAALQEIITRRYKNPDELPDLMLIDGGKGQLSAARAIFPQATIASLAKREERLFCGAAPEGILLDLHTTVGKSLIELRDYTHHFAISYHRLSRKKRLLTK
jgi:excinuclease ABC subunit C